MIVQLSYRTTVKRVTSVAALFVSAVLLACLPKAYPPTYLDQHLWEAYKTRFIDNGRVIDSENGNISHSEGQGYGMLLAEAASDRETFDDLWLWTRSNLKRPDGLFSWRWEPGVGITDSNNATDGEILVAWALLRASIRWDEDSYRRAALNLLRKVRRLTLAKREGGTYIIPGLDGFTQPDGLVVNPSYWVFPALYAFVEFDEVGAETWHQVIETGYELLEASAKTPSGLVPDWVILARDNFLPAPGFPPRFSWDAVRAPLHVAWAGNRPDLLTPYVRFWQLGTERSMPPAWINLESGEVANYGISTGVLAIATVSEAVLAEKIPTNIPEPSKIDGYFSSSLALLARLAAHDLEGNQN